MSAWMLSVEEPGSEARRNLASLPTGVCQRYVVIAPIMSGLSSYCSFELATSCAGTVPCFQKKMSSQFDFNILLYTSNRQKSSSLIEKGSFLPDGGGNLGFFRGAPAVRFLPAGVSYSGRLSIPRDSTRAGRRRIAPAALLMSPASLPDG